ncbi:MAG: glycosyltransferase family 9 protein [Deltaproteobacteria bacterium]|nr:glycosyltransferase family 9 protein [Deltaproteobacteria bacterium]
MKYQEKCRWFNGYKPCKFKRSCTGCPEFSEPEVRIAILCLDAMGAVLRATCLLPPLRREYPEAHITWITYPQCRALLENNPEIDRIISFEAKSVPLLRHLEFDLLYSVDKSAEAGALAEDVRARKKFGFGLSREGAIRPFNKEAAYQYDLGLNDELKFFVNQKPETCQITETMGLAWERDSYLFRLSQQEQCDSEAIRQDVLKRCGTPAAVGIIGYNTGCSLLYPNKKLTISRSAELIREWRRNFPDYCIALLGGPEDTGRNQKLAEIFCSDPMVWNSPTTEGLRHGFVVMNCVDIVFSGCSLGMHMAIALEKKVIAWFGVSCLQEIDLYDRGIRIQSDVSCSPCWKRSCQQTDMCYDQVSLETVIRSTQRLLTEPGPYQDEISPRRFS